MAKMFDIIVENAILNAKTAILEEAAGTTTGERYIYIVESAGDTLKKAKNFVVNNKGKLAALAGTAALAGAGAYAYDKHEHAVEAERARENKEANEALKNDPVEAVKNANFKDANATDEKIKKGPGSLLDKYKIPETKLTKSEEPTAGTQKVSVFNSPKK